MAQDLSVLQHDCQMASACEDSGLDFVPDSESVVDSQRLLGWSTARRVPIISSMADLESSSLQNRSCLSLTDESPCCH
jgi:hypothetical protein